MKKLTRSLLILILPILIMVLINEVVRLKIHDEPNKIYGIKTINSEKFLPEKCTWACHNETIHCKRHHVKYLKKFYSTTDFFYFGTITVLRLSGNYVFANIIFLVILFPITILFFIIKSLNIEDDIRKLSK
jgi:hypothetical protein